LPLPAPLWPVVPVCERVCRILVVQEMARFGCQGDWQ
jgi:hypothetical protein